MTPEELAAIRAWWSARPGEQQAHKDVSALADEVDALLELIDRLPGGDQELRRTGRR